MLPEHQKPEPPPFEIDLNDPWITEVRKRRGIMTDEEMIADFMNNEGRQTEEWPDFGAR